MAEPEVVEGMSEAVERRALELGLAPGTFAARARLTPQGLEPVRAGERRNYQRKTIVGVARALRWPLDWYERLQNGEVDLPHTDHPEQDPDVEERLTALEEQMGRVLAHLEVDDA